VGQSKRTPGGTDPCKREEFFSKGFRDEWRGIWRREKSRLKISGKIKPLETVIRGRREEKFWT